MQKIVASFKRNSLVWILSLLILPSFVSLIRPGFFTMHDDLQAFRIHQMDKCFQDFQLPCRWIPDMGFRYGYPQFNFYPPSVYYLGEVFHLAGFQFIDAAKILFALGFVTSAFGMYLFLKEWLGKWPAVVGAVFYTYAPYKAVDVYVRGAMSEFWALTFFPLIFWAVLKLVKTEKNKYIGYLALFIGLLFITHNLMPLIFAPLIAVWTIGLLVLEKKWKVVRKIFWGVLLGAGLAAFFSLPLVFEKQYVHIESIVGGYFDYRLHFVNLNELFLLNTWGYGSSVWGVHDGLSLSTGQIHVLVGIIALTLSVVTFKKNQTVALLTIALFATELAVLFLIHQKSSFIWSALPFMQWLQFPWRFLGDSIFLLSMFAGVAVYIAAHQNYVRDSRLAYIMGIMLIAGLFILHITFFQPRIWLDLTDAQKFSGKSWQNQLTISIFDYLPIYAILPPTSEAPEKPEILEGIAKFDTYQKGSNYQFGKIDVSKEALIRLPLFDFPGMRVWIDGKEVVHWHDDCRGQEYCLGLITLKIPEGNHVINTRLTDTPVRSAGNSMSFISILITGWLIFGDRKNKQT